MERSTMLLRTVNLYFNGAIYPSRAIDPIDPIDPIGCGVADPIGAPVLWDPPESIGEAAPGYQVTMENHQRSWFTSGKQSQKNDFDMERSTTIFKLGKSTISMGNVQ